MGIAKANPDVVTVHFHNLQEWQQWAELNRTSFDRWRSDVIAAVQADGLVEPISERRHAPESIVIDRANLRESISVNGMNSRKRACLYVLDQERRRLPTGRSGNPRILGTEALTKVALVLRSRFLYYLGTEYLPTEEDKLRHYPTRHLDLMAIDAPADMFDMYHSGDVLEHVPSIDRALAEVFRVLAPGGVAVSTFPFNCTSEETTIKAELLPNGTVKMHGQPEYHGNPARPDEGSLVFSIPGWGLLKTCAAIGYVDAHMTLVISKQFGIAASGQAPGALVFVARKPI